MHSGVIDYEGRDPMRWLIVLLLLSGCAHRQQPLYPQACIPNVPGMAGDVTCRH